MEEDELDPRIQVELEKLNTATDEINKLEIELDEANTTFRMLLNECTRRLKVHSNKFGSAIVSARPYYEALDVARVAQQECQRAAVSFQRANEVHEAAKETVALAETRFLSQPEWRFDSAWQEMLNHATLKVRDAEKQRAESAAYHGQATARYKQAQDKVQQLDQRLHRNVAKSRPYFEEKARCNDQLAAQKAVVEALQNHVSKVKTNYADSLRRLEGISEEIHRKRADMLAACRGVREPGVGAELEYEGELKDLETLRLSLDAHHASRSPDGDAKTTLPPGTSRLPSKSCSSPPGCLGDVYDHFAELEEIHDSSETSTELAKVPVPDLVAQSCAEKTLGDDVVVSELTGREDERRSSQVDGEPSDDSVISQGAVTTGEGSLTIDKSEAEHIKEDIPSCSDIDVDSKDDDETAHVESVAINDTDITEDVSVDNPTDGTKALTREPLQDGGVLVKHNIESIEVIAEESSLSVAGSTSGSSRPEQ